MGTRLWLFLSGLCCMLASEGLKRLLRDFTYPGRQGGNMIPKRVCRWLIIFSLIMVAGCALSWVSALNQAQDDIPTPDSIQKRVQADALYNHVDDLESLVTAIEAYRAVLAVNPGDYKALVQLSNLHILMGTAYARSRADKSLNFTKAMHYAELAMYTNASFKARVRQGKKPWQAADRLGKEETEAMFFWVTALHYEFKESMNLADKIRNVNWFSKGLAFLDRIEAVNPEFGGGAVEFAKFITYYVLPKSKGGSKEKGKAYLKKAVARGKRRLMPRWGRAKYYYARTGNTQAAREDMQWVVSREPQVIDDPYPWREYFQKDAETYLRRE
jgi:hypothetical protein